MLVRRRVKVAHAINAPDSAFIRGSQTMNRIAAVSRTVIEQQSAGGRAGRDGRHRRSPRRALIAACMLALATFLGWWLHAASSEAASELTLISPPTISGTARVGQTLTEDRASWSPTPRGPAYQWEDCDASGQSCHSISGATHQTFAVSSSDLGHTLRVEEIAFSWSGIGRATSAATAVVSNAPIPVPRSSSTTSLTSLESSAVTDQIVTLIGTVTASSAIARPSGTLTFENGGAPIGGCQDESVLPTGQSVTVTCVTSFAAATQELTAVFTPSAGSTVGGSASVPEALVVAPDPTTTSLDVADPTVHVNRSATFTATVRPSYLGPMEPSQTVAFFDSGKPLPACASRPVVWTGAAAVATCTVRFTRRRQHLITASYLGDANFASSASSPAGLVDAVAGRIHPMLSWTFFYTPRYTKVLRLRVDHAASGTRVRVTCAGRGCPRKAHTVILRRSRSSARGASLMALFLRHRLRPGTVITVSIQRKGWIGKRYAFKIRAGHAPRHSITCQAPGLAPGVGC